MYDLLQFFVTAWTLLGFVYMWNGNIRAVSRLIFSLLQLSRAATPGLHSKIGRTKNPGPIMDRGMGSPLSLAIVTGLAHEPVVRGLGPSPSSALYVYICQRAGGWKRQ